MINNMLKLNKKMVQNRNYYHTCPACRINIFNADFRIFFLYNRAGNKTDEICAPNVLTEARVSGLKASVLRTPDRQVHLSLPLIASCLLGRQGPSPLLAALLLGRTALRAARKQPWLKAQSSESQQSPDGLGDSSGLCLAALKPGEKLLRDLPTPCLSLDLLESRRRRWRALLSP